jgi:hypothetical protein
MPSEYTNSAVGSGMGSYRSNSFGNTTMADVQPGTDTGSYLTPSYGAISYEALTHGKSSGQSYFNIQKAYGGNGSSGCGTSYTQRMCGGGGGVGHKFACVSELGGPNKCVVVKNGTKQPRGTISLHDTVEQCQAQCNSVRPNGFKPSSFNRY